ncbi:MAG: hypothetical protein Q4D06_05375, partial [Coriobacteriia bacterium]|nr:hypothetical protein [Coriobacteriia bacterium]
AKKKDGKKSSAGKGDKKNKDKGKNPEEQGKKPDKSGKGKNAKNEIKVYKDYGEFAEVPEEIKHVTAVGEAAVVVSMLGGTEKDTPLVGADADFVENEQIQRVMASKGVDKVKKVWKDDGTEKGDLSSVKKIIDLDPELCFVMEGDETLTKKQEDELLKNNIIVYVIPNMASASKITYAVKLVGDILEKGGNEQAGKVRDAYLEFHDDLVKHFKDENGGLTGGFNYDTGKKASTDATTVRTLMITDWDKDARYEDGNGFLSSDQGVAVAELGYEEDPSAYYLSVGGALNNAAAGQWRGLSGRTAGVWQFTTSKAPVSWRKWTSIDRQKITYAPDPQGFDTALMWSVEGKCGLGTKEFPAVVVSTQEQKDLLDQDAHRDNGLYHPYSVVSKGDYATYSSVGFINGPDSNLVDACIGTHGMGTQSSLNDGTTVNYYDVYVNPTGLFSNWRKGGVESVLEASWTFQKFRKADYPAEADVQHFYKEFYGYELSSQETEEIMNGPES